MNNVIRYFLVSSIISSLGIVSSAQASDVKFYQNCPITGDVGYNSESLTLLGILAKAVIPVAVDWGAAALAAQGEPDTKTWNMKGSSYLYNLSLDKGIESMDRFADWGCLVIAIPDTSAKSGDKPLNSTFDKEYKNKVLEDNSYASSLPNDPLIYVELAIVNSKDDRFFKLDARALYYKKTTVSGWWNKKRDLSLTLSFNKPGGEKPFASTIISFENLSPGDYQNFKANNAKIGSVTTEWLEIAGLDQEDQKIITEYKTKYQEAERSKKQHKAYTKQITELENVVGTPYPPVDKNIYSAITEYCNQLKIAEEKTESCPPRIYLAKRHATYELTRLESLKTLANLKAQQEPETDDTPEAKYNNYVGAFNIAASVTETRNASEFLKNLSVAVNNSKKDLSDELVKKLVPEDRKAAKQAERDADIVDADKKDDALIAALTAHKLIAEAQSALDTAKANPETTATELTTFKYALLIAKINANKANRSAGLPTIPVEVPIP